MIGFATPWILVALAVLPVLWWLLRVTPPSPRLVRFPAIRLLRDLVQREETPARTPLWLILMRILLATLLIVALAGPILRPSTTPPGRGPEIIVVDTGWAAAEAWPAIKTALLAELDRDERAGMSVVLAPTARLSADTPIAPIGPQPAGEARRIAEALTPSPWLADRNAAATILQRFDGRSSALFLSDGVAGPGDEPLAGALAGFTQPRILTPIPAALPRLLLPPEQGPDMVLTVRRGDEGPALPLILIARGQDGRVLGEASGAFDNGNREAHIRFDLPNEIRNKIARIDIAGSRNAGSVVLLDERWRRRPVGIVTPAAGDEANQLLSGAFYLKRALEPFAEVRTGDVDSLLRGQPAVLILTDSIAVSPGEKHALANWITQGGLLLRFSGPKLAGTDPEPDDPLLPTDLRTGGRSLSGALSWTQPATLAPFPDAGPFAGLETPKEVTVSRQILAEPTLELDRKVWARLADGTPLITADKRGKGTIVLFHTTADPSWSNLALSGLFPQILRRIVGYSAGIGLGAAHGILEPYRVLDAFGRLQNPDGAVAAVPVESFGQLLPEPAHPPGYYGEADSRRALNLTQNLTVIAPLNGLPAKLEARHYTTPGEVSLAPSLLAAALLLAAIDTVIALWLGGSLPSLPRFPRRSAPMGIFVLALLCLPGLTQAQTRTGGPDAKVAEAAAAVTLGYVATGDAVSDRVSRAGLAGLARQLILRTSINHAAPAEVNLERDELSVYPLLYWAITASAQPLSDQAKGKLNRYLETGGVILIDTRAGANGARANLGKLIEGIEVPALAPIPKDHVLTRSFYLLDDFPGRLSGGAVWVESDQDTRNDGVSSVVVGSADWAGAWAADDNGVPMFSALAGGERQREWAYRFGINLVMYALTGNYKSDLVHLPFIKQRLGQ
jgi:hypothetical protein